jgi:predicted DNA-binding ribbon-helix-helix protein
MKIAEETSVEDVLKEYPALSRVFVELRVQSLVCGNPYWGTIEELAKQYNINVQKLVKKLNEKKGELDEKL